MVLILGAGEQGRIVLDNLSLLGISVKGFLDDYKTGEINTVPILGKIGDIEKNPNRPKENLYIALGNGQLRKKFFDKVSTKAEFPNLIHPTSIISKTSEIPRNSGIYVGPGVIINTNAKVGKFALLNSGSIIEHDVEIGDFCSVAPGAIIAGGVKLQRFVTVGLGAKILDDLIIGENTIIGAGAVVTTSFTSNLKVFGVPAKIKP